MEVKIEETEQSKFQAKQNQTGIPFPHWASRPDREAHLYSVPIVRGVPLSRTWFSVPGWGRGVYAHTTDETIWEGGHQINMPFPSRSQVDFTRSSYPSGTRIVLSRMDSMWGGYVTKYVVTETPESEIQAWVEAKKAEQN